MIEKLLQEKLLELNRNLMDELSDKFISHLREKLRESKMSDIQMLQADYIVSYLLLVIYILNKKEDKKDVNRK